MESLHHSIPNGLIERFPERRKYYDSAEKIVQKIHVLDHLEIPQGHSQRTGLIFYASIYENRLDVTERSKVLVRLSNPAEDSALGSLSEEYKDSSYQLVEVPHQVAQKFLDSYSSDYVYVGAHCDADGAPIKDIITLSMSVEFLTQNLSESIDQQCQLFEYRSCVEYLDEFDMSVALIGLSLGQWNRWFQRCPQHGLVLTVEDAGWMRVCPEDQSQHFPRTDPVVIMLIVDDQGRLLLGNNTLWQPERFSLISGFIDSAESIEQACAREATEEANTQIDVSTIDYISSQYWPYQQSLMIGMIVQATNPDQSQADGYEMREVRWFDRQQYKEAQEDKKFIVPSAHSISGWLIDLWLHDKIPSGVFSGLDQSLDGTSSHHDSLGI